MGLHPPNEQFDEAAAFVKRKFTAHCFCGRDDICPLELEFLKNCGGQGIRKPERHKVNRDSVFPVR
jgi:hypothetical protein